MSTQAPRLPIQEEDDDIKYPDSDGQPMAEGDAARDLMIDTLTTLQSFYAVRPDVYVSGNILLYYEKGNPKRCIAPDILVAFDIPKHQRDIYKVWQEGKAPDVMMELASQSTWRNDVFRKVSLYHRLGVQEYILFDRLGEWFKAGQISFLRSEEEGFVSVLPNERGRFYSERLGLEIQAEGQKLSFFDPQTGDRLKTPEEQTTAAKQQAAAAQQQAAAAQQQTAAAQQQAQRETELREAAEQRLRDLEAQLKRLQEGQAGS